MIVGNKFNSESIPFRSIGGSVVECSPATRAARVRFPADANLLFNFSFFFLERDFYLHTYPL